MKWAQQRLMHSKRTTLTREHTSNQMLDELNSEEDYSAHEV